MRLTVWLLVALAVMAQAPAEPPRHDKYKDDPGAYCLPAQPVEGDTHGHECHCALVCNHEGQQVEQNTCEMWCSKSRCACWPDEPCPQPEGV